MASSKRARVLGSSTIDAIDDVPMMSSQLEAVSGSTKNIMWTAEMDSCLTEALIEHMNKGNKPKRSFTNHAYQAACSELYAKCGIKIIVGHLKNRLKTLKKDLAAFQDIQNFGSGFAFNKVTRMMDAEPHVWKEYLIAHPEGKPYQHKPVPSFENLQLLFGKDRASGKVAETAKERRIRLEKEKEESTSVTDNQEGDKDVDADDDIESIGPSIHKVQDPKISSTSSAVTYKRKHMATSSLSDDFQILKSGMDSVASAISKRGPRVYTEEEIFEEVLKVEGLDEDEQLLAYDYLCGDAIRGRTFIGLPIFRRKRWLEIKLGWSSHTFSNQC